MSVKADVAAKNTNEDSNATFATAAAVAPAVVSLSRPSSKGDHGQVIGSNPPARKILNHRARGSHQSRQGLRQLIRRGEAQVHVRVQDPQEDGRERRGSKARSGDLNADVDSGSGRHLSLPPSTAPTRTCQRPSSIADISKNPCNLFALMNQDSAASIPHQVHEETVESTCQWPTSPVSTWSRLPSLRTRNARPSTSSSARRANMPMPPFPREALG